MGKRRAQQQLQTVDAPETALEEEISVSAEFDLPMTLISASLRDGWGEEPIHRVLDSLRAVDPAAQPDPSEFLIVLPNTSTDVAQVVEQRLEKAVPEAVPLLRPTRGATR